MNSQLDFGIKEGVLRRQDRKRASRLKGYPKALTLGVALHRREYLFLPPMEMGDTTLRVRS